MLVASVALAGTATATAVRRAPSDDGTLSIRDGKASMQLRMRGAVIGRIARGQLTVTDPLTDTATVVVRGAERQRDVNDRTTTYAGTDIRFRIVDEQRVVVRLVNAKGINLSAVGRGEGWLDGAGDREGVDFDGYFSQNGAPYRSIPDDRVRIELDGSPAAP